MLCCACLLIGSPPARAEGAGRIGRADIEQTEADPPHSPRSPCVQAAFDAERETGVPVGLLLAIGRIESGRPDPVDGRVAPWPWTTNYAGEGRFFQTRGEALAYARELRAQGAQSVDVGCFQVNLFYHAQAFATLEEAFDPAANARYAARFLATLRDRGGDWPSAVGLYHSATPEQGDWYRDRVLASWNGGDLVVSPRLRAAFAARPRMADPHVVLVDAGYGLRIWASRAPGGASGRASGRAPVLEPIVVRMDNAPPGTTSMSAAPALAATPVVAPSAIRLAARRIARPVPRLSPRAAPPAVSGASGPAARLDALRSSFLTLP